jgi:hypothetical protein
MSPAALGKSIKIACLGPPVCSGSSIWRPGHQLRPPAWPACSPRIQPTTKYCTYICRVQSNVWRLQKYWPPTPSPPSECPPTRTKGEGYTLAGRWGPGGGSIVWKTPDIGLASYRITPQELHKIAVPYVTGLWIPQSLSINNGRRIR